MKTALVLGLTIAALGVACRGTLPPNEPPRSSPEGAPAMHTNDAPTVGPRADENLASPPDTLPGPTNPAGIAEPPGGGKAGGGNH
jgi:hypothetical protein